MRNRYVFFVVLLLLEGVFGAENYDKTVSVMEGDYVILNPVDTKILEDDTFQWSFDGKLIARMKADKTISTSEGDDAEFKGRLKLDQTGSLTIANIRTTDSGLYKIIIKSTTETTMTFKVTVREMKFMSVMEGDSVTLQFDTEIQRDDQILWMFGPRNTHIAEINKVDAHSLHEDVLGGIFRGRLKLDHQNGSLTITDTRTKHTGLYNVVLTSSSSSSSSSSRESKYTRFIVTLNDVESLSVMEGDPVTLYTNFAKIQRNDQIKWKFGDQVILTDHLNSDVDASWKNIDLNNETGDLTIRNIRTDQSGDYEVEIKNSDNGLILHRKFRITSGQDQINPKTLIGIIVLVLVLVAAIAGFVIYWKKHRQPRRNHATAGEVNGLQSGETEVS